MRQSQSSLRKRLSEGRKLSMLTCYDASLARIMDKAGVDMLLVGDSLGMVVQGHDSTIPVTIDDMVYHTGCVSRGACTPWIVADMSFGSYHESPSQAMHNAVKLMQAGAQMVKLEGGVEIASTIQMLTQHGIPVCAHIGLTPQQVHKLGGYRVQGKTSESEQKLFKDLQAVESAGASMVVIEAVPDSVTRRLLQQTKMITIGIGASVACDAQVLVVQDMLGMTDKPAKFVKNFTQGLDSTQGNIIEQAIASFVTDVAEARFPSDEHVYSMS